jgi:hypothetical protein
MAWRKGQTRMLNQTAGQGLIDDSEGCGKNVPQGYNAYPVIVA